MTTLVARPGTALLVIDVQNAVVADAHDRDAVISRISGLVDRARNEEVPVVWVQHFDVEEMPAGSDGWRIVSELVPAAGEPVIAKTYADSFEDTDLEPVLCGLAVRRLLVAGAQTDACIRATLHGAFTRGYDTVLVADAHTTEDQTAYGNVAPGEVIAHTNLYWKHHDGPGRTAGTVDAADVSFG